MWVVAIGLYVCGRVYGGGGGGGGEIKGGWFRGGWAEFVVTYF